MRLTSAWTSGLAAACLMIGAGATAGPAAAEDVTLKMAVPDWPPTHIMKDLADKYYKAPSHWLSDTAMLYFFSPEVSEALRRV